MNVNLLRLLRLHNGDAHNVMEWASFHQIDLCSVFDLTDADYAFLSAGAKQRKRLVEVRGTFADGTVWERELLLNGTEMDQLIVFLEDDEWGAEPEEYDPEVAARLNRAMEGD